MVLKEVFKISDITKFETDKSININNHLFCFEKTTTTYLKAKSVPYTQHEFLALKFKYVFIVFSRNKQMIKYTFINIITPN